MSRPNILLITADQLRADCIGSYGNSICRTPHIDELAQSGMRLERAYTPISVCSPARASLMTGLYPHKHEVLINTHIDTRTRRGLDPALPNFGCALANLGYHLEYFGKWHVNEDLDPCSFGFHSYKPLHSYALGQDAFKDEIHLDFKSGRQRVSATTKRDQYESSSYRMAEAVASCLEQHKQSANDQPFFIRADFLKPHFPNIVPEPYASMYNAVDIPPWVNFAESFEGKPIGHLRKHREWALQDKTWEGWWQNVVRKYYADISYLDACCGVILNALKRTGLDQNTIVVFTADHGDSMGSHRHFEKGGAMYEEVYRIPMIIRWPGVTAPGSSTDGFVRLLDLMPTFISMAGGMPPEHIDGVDLSPLLKSEATDWFDSVYTEYHGDVWGPYTQRMVRTDAFKYVYNPYDIDELYDLTIDPFEMTNRVTDPSYSKVLEEMQGRLHGWIIHTKDVFTYHFVTRNLPAPIIPRLPQLPGCRQTVS